MRYKVKRFIKNRLNYYNLIKRTISLAKSKYPKVILISIPKSGTHLIGKTLLQLGFVKKFFVYSELAETAKDEGSILVGLVSPKINSYKGVRERFSKIKTKEFVMGHLPFSTKANDLLNELNFKKILILRDPRDVVLSHYHWIKNPVHPLNPHISKIGNPEEQFMACIKGWSKKETESSDFFLTSIAKRIQFILPWFNDPDCLVVRFEDLIGPRGSGNLETQKSVIRTIAYHLNVTLNKGQIDSVTRRVFDTSSWTFRKGQIGGWKKHFTPLHKAEFKELAGSFLIELGYEKDLNW